MTLTLDEVRQTRFHIARRAGYEVTDVDNFVDKVEATMMSLTDENETLKKQLSSVESTGEPSSAVTAENERLRRELEQLRAAGTGAGAASAQTDSLRRENAELQRRLREAEQQLEEARQAAGPDGEPQQRLVVQTSADASPAVVRLVQLATDQAEQLVSEADAEAKRKLDEATREAHEITVDARTKAERVESEARVNAERVTSQAQAKADNLEKDVATRRAELFSGLETERDDLSARVQQLRTFEQSFRTNLTSHLQTHIEHLEKGTAEPAEVPSILSDQAAQPQGQSSTPRLDALLGDRH